MKELFCFSRRDAGIFYRDTMNWQTNTDLPKDVAIISIAGTETSQLLYLKEEEPHWFEESINVLNLNFDDVTEDVYVYKGITFHGISEEDTDRAIEFIIKNINKNIYVNCRAGKSRSQAFVRFIIDMFPDRESKFNLANPPQAAIPNPGVLQKLKRRFFSEYWDVYYELSKFLNITKVTKLDKNTAIYTFTNLQELGDENSVMYINNGDHNNRDFPGIFMIGSKKYLGLEELREILL